MIAKIFEDSKFIASAWYQMLETHSPETVIFFSDNGNITIGEIISALEGKNLNTNIEKEIFKFFQGVVSEAIKIVRGKFSSGLGD